MHQAPLRAAIFGTISLVLPLAVGCQLTSADEVSRPPTIVRGSGGSGGHDVASLAERPEDTPDADGARPDSACSADIALATDVTIDRPPTSDVPRLDGTSSRIESGVAGETGQASDVGLTCD